MDGVKVFSVTMQRDREMLGDRVTAWLRDNPDKEIIDKIVLQSSDDAFHCISCILFYVLR